MAAYSVGMASSSSSDGVGVGINSNYNNSSRLRRSSGSGLGSSLVGGGDPFLLLSPAESIRRSSTSTSSEAVLQWTERQLHGAVPVAMSGHATVIWERQLYVFGGYNNGQALAQVYQIDLDTYVCQELQTFGERPSPRTSHSAVIDDKRGLVYVLCGSGSLFGQTNLGDIFEFDLRYRSWRKLEFTGAVLTPRYGQTAVFYNRRIYVHGGTFGIDFTSETYEYNLETMVGRVVPVSRPEQAPSPRYKHSAVVVNTHYMLVFGGAEGQSYRLNDMYQLDLNTFEWSMLHYETVVPPRIVGMASTGGGGVVELSQLHLGQPSHPAPPQQPTIPVIAPDPNGAEEPLNGGLAPADENGDSLPGRFAHSMYSRQNKVYLFGGTDRLTLYNELWVLDVPSRTWTRMSVHASSRPRGRYFLGAVVDEERGEFVVFGGKGSTSEQLRFNDLHTIPIFDIPVACSLAHDLVSLYMKKDMCDVEFVCTDELVLNAHTFIIKTRCAVLDRHLKDAELKSSQLSLDADFRSGSDERVASLHVPFDSVTFHLLLQFLYTDQLSLSAMIGPMQYMQVLLCAHHYALPRLMGLAQQRVERYMTPALAMQCWSDRRTRDVIPFRSFLIAFIRVSDARMLQHKVKQQEQSYSGGPVTASSRGVSAATAAAAAVAAADQKQGASTPSAVFPFDPYLDADLEQWDGMVVVPPVTLGLDIFRLRTDLALQQDVPYDFRFCFLNPVNQVQTEIHAHLFLLAARAAYFGSYTFRRGMLEASTGQCDFQYGPTQLSPLAFTVLIEYLYGGGAILHSSDCKFRAPTAPEHFFADDDVICADVEFEQMKAATESSPAMQQCRRGSFHVLMSPARSTPRNSVVRTLGMIDPSLLLPHQAVDGNSPIVSPYVSPSTSPSLRRPSITLSTISSFPALPSVPEAATISIATTFTASAPQLIVPGGGTTVVPLPTLSSVSTGGAGFSSGTSSSCVPLSKLSSTPVPAPSAAPATASVPSSVRPPAPSHLVIPPAGAGNSTSSKFDVSLAHPLPHPLPSPINVVSSNDSNSVSVSLTIGDGNNNVDEITTKRKLHRSVAALFEAELEQKRTRLQQQSPTLSSGASRPMRSPPSPSSPLPLAAADAASVGVSSSIPSEKMAISPTMKSTMAPASASASASALPLSAVHANQLFVPASMGGNDLRFRGRIGASPGTPPSPVRTVPSSPPMTRSGSDSELQFSRRVSDVSVATSMSDTATATVLSAGLVSIPTPTAVQASSSSCLSSSSSSSSGPAPAPAPSLSHTIAEELLVLDAGNYFGLSNEHFQQFLMHFLHPTPAPSPPTTPRTPKQHRSKNNNMELQDIEDQQIDDYDDGDDDDYENDHTIYTHNLTQPLTGPLSNPHVSSDLAFDSVARPRPNSDHRRGSASNNGGSSSSSRAGGGASPTSSTSSRSRTFGLLSALRSLASKFMSPPSTSSSSSSSSSSGSVTPVVVAATTARHVGPSSYPSQSFRANGLTSSSAIASPPVVSSSSSTSSTSSPFSSVFSSSSLPPLPPSYPLAPTISSPSLLRSLSTSSTNTSTATMTSTQALHHQQQQLQLYAQQLQHQQDSYDDDHGDDYQLLPEERSSGQYHHQRYHQRGPPYHDDYDDNDVSDHAGGTATATTTTTTTATSAGSSLSGNSNRSNAHGGGTGTGDCVSF